MHLPGLLIEYLISGALALTWIHPLLKDRGLTEVGPGMLSLLAISLYVVGMVIDFIAFWLVKPLKPFVRRYAWKKCAMEGVSAGESSVERQIRFSLYSREIAQEMAMRSSRDRVARGAIVNALFVLALVLSGVIYADVGGAVGWSAAAVVVAAVVWWMFESMSYSYELRADALLKRKLREERDS